MVFLGQWRKRHSGLDVPSFLRITRPCSLFDFFLPCSTRVIDLLHEDSEEAQF